MSTLDMLILSHPHEDHVGGAESLLRTLEVGKLVISSRSLFLRDRPRLLEAAQRHGVPVEEWQAPRSLDWQAVRIDVLHPGPAFLQTAQAISDYDPNELSLVLRIWAKEGGACAYLPGDAESDAEKAILRTNSVEPCGLLKVAHHGSRSSTGSELLARLRPRWALISAGYDNRYGHPHRETVARLASYGVETRVTAHAGTLTATALGTGWKVECFRAFTCGAMAPLRWFLVEAGSPVFLPKQ